MSSYHSSGEHLDFTPVADVSAGTLHQVGGMAGIANVDIEAGKVGALAIRGTVRVISDGTAAFADGATVGYDQSADRAVGAGLGDFDIGTAVGAVAMTAGAEVIVLLNAIPL